MDYATKQRWVELVEFLGGTRAFALTWHQRLVACYSEKHRRYHTLQHIEECLEELDEIEGDEERLALIEIALWFHDAVYQPLANDNEERSFAMAKEFMLECEATESVIEFVRDMILATKKHRAKDDMDAAIMIGLDLNIFAREPKRYTEYEKQIREEYAAVPLAEYCSKRAAILEEFLARPVIYESETIREVYEEPARFNLETAIARLKSGIA